MTLPAQFHDSKVCILGLGYVGLTLATVMAEVGFEVFGVEIREDVVSALKRGESHFHEPGIEERLKRVIEDERLHVSSTIPEACPATVYIITVGTPLDSRGAARLDMVEHVGHEVAKVLRDGDLVIMRSTVKLGTTRNVVKKILEKSGRSFELAFCPERTLEGQALEELRTLPQIVAGGDHSTGMRAAHIFQFITPTVVRVSDFETGEMIKMVDNSQRDVAFAFANEVARLCDASGVSAYEVISAGKLGYPRTNLPMPGPVGGPCLSKDPYILAESFEGMGIEPEMALAARRINERQPEEIAEYLRNEASALSDFPAEPVVAMLGIAFKGRPATDDLRGTMARPILDVVRKQFPAGIYRGYDAEVGDQEIEEFGLVPCPTIDQATRGAHLVMILNNHEVFGTMQLEDLAHEMGRPSIVYDLWNTFVTSDLRLPKGCHYVALGSHGKRVVGDRG